MRVLPFVLAVTIGPLTMPHHASADELPKQLSSAACRAAPTVDGVIGPDEWPDASPITFDMKMVQKDAPTPTTCAAQLRVMNSANGLYITLQVPDETVNNSLSPVNVDFALLAFCRGKQLAAGDDRKVVIPGMYVDKHYTSPGKDADDTQQDGRGAMAHDQGICSIEWAIPLNSGDANDVQVKPGDVLRWNVAYFDGFQGDLSGVKIGVPWNGDFNDAAGWGTIQLAADVQDDGGQALRGPAWVAAIFEGLPDTGATRLRLTESTLLPGAPVTIAKALFEYTYLDTRGEETVGKAKVYMPASVQDRTTQVPLYYSAGYELDDRTALIHTRRGFTVVTPRDLKANPLVQTPNPDAALLHIARSLPFVDDARVVIGGGSAGGYLTLMLAAETFPLSGAAADVPPMNWGYNAAYFLQKDKWTKSPASETKAPELPVFSAVAPIAEQALAVYGGQTDDIIWFRHSPLSQLDTITCPVLAYWSTADMLVPIDQISRDWIRPFDPAVFPGGFSMNPDNLTSTPEGRLRAMDALVGRDYELFVLSEEQVKQRTANPQDPPELPFSRKKPWSIVILDEGAPEPQLGHVKYGIAWSRYEFIDYVAGGKFQASQLTDAKLQRMMDRYRGKEWLPTKLKHLDLPEFERADVIRGLKLYVSASPEHAARFRDLYAGLSADRKVLEPEAWNEILAPQ